MHYSLSPSHDASRSLFAPAKLAPGDEVGNIPRNSNQRFAERRSYRQAFDHMFVLFNKRVYSQCVLCSMGSRYKVIENSDLN